MRRRLPWLTILRLEALQQYAQHFIRLAINDKGRSGVDHC